MAHFTFSQYGFNPTDDGIFLSYSRRILAGQIPHKDFVSVRTLASAYLHVSVVAFGGDYTYWLSRLIVWFQFVIISWCWVSVQRRLMRLTFPSILQFMVTLVAFIFTAHTFPAMAWSTIDGLFFISLGTRLILSDSEKMKLGGYFLLGLAILTRQAFIFILPIAFVFGDWKKLKYLLALFTPSLIYFGTIGLHQGLRDAYLQLLSFGEYFAYLGVFNFTSKILVVEGVLTGLIIGFFSFIQVKNGRGKWVVFLLRVMILFFVFYKIASIASMLRLKSYEYYQKQTFMLFGIAEGFVLVALFKRDSKMVLAGMLTVIVAWTSALSLGYQTPALAGGILVASILSLIYSMYVQSRNKNLWLHLYYFCCLFLSTSISLKYFIYARQNIIYLDLPSKELNYSLDGIFPGARLLKTNRNTYDFLLDFRQALEKTHGRRYAILPEMAGWWTKSSQKNPLPLDWLNYTEFGLDNPDLRKRYVDSALSQQGNLVLIVQKVSASRLAEGFYPLDFGYTILPLVLSSYEKFDQTKYFDLYR